MFYIYILHAESSDKFYVGYTADPDRRIVEHNHSDRNTFTAKYRPWRIAALFKVSEVESEAVKIERFIKKQKSRKLIGKVIQPDLVGTGTLASLVRVPHLRD
jgi:putative endonuclease